MAEIHVQAKKKKFRRLVMDFDLHNCHRGDRFFTDLEQQGYSNKCDSTSDFLRTV